MNSQKCTKCGLVSWADTETCKRCGESLLEQSRIDASTDEPAKYGKLPDFISYSLLGVVLVSLGFKEYMGPFGYPLSMLALITGLGYSILRVYRSTRVPRLDRKRDAMSALAVNAVLLMVMGAAVPAYVLSRNPDTKPFEWREYTSAVGHFKVQLPDDPQEIHKDVTTARGTLKLNGVIVKMGRRGEYFSGYYDLSNYPVKASDDDFIDFIIQYTASQTKKQLYKKPLVFKAPDGLTVKAVEVELQRDLQTTSILRLYWASEQAMLYLTVVEYQPATTNDISAEKFLESFKLTGF
jgi:hypothetical protein